MSTPGSIARVASSTRMTDEEPSATGVGDDDESVEAAVQKASAELVAAAKLSPLQAEGRRCELAQHAVSEGRP